MSAYTESLYRASARLVRYLAARYHVPLDRAHIIGHDNVPAPDPRRLGRMHSDPGPYWDWDHYMDLLGQRPPRTGATDSAMVRITPSYGSNRPPVTACGRGCRTLPSQPASFVYLRTRPAEDASLLADPALGPGKPGTTRLDDLGDKAASGQRFVVAERRAGWTAIWYAGRKAWYSDTDGINSAAAHGPFVRPRPGRASIPVYGRAHPEAAAFPSTVPVQPVVALPYTIPAGQATPHNLRSKATTTTRTPSTARNQVTARSCVDRSGTCRSSSTTDSRSCGQPT